MDVLIIGVGVVVVALVAALVRTRNRRGALELSRTGQRGLAGRQSDNSTAPTEFVLEGPDGRQLFAEIVDRTECVLWERDDGLPTNQSSLFALDKVLAAIPTIGVALKGGQYVRILNPEALALGDQLKSTAGGFLGAVYGEKSIVTQLRFTKPQSVAAVAAPIAVFQVASAVTGQYYLDRINKQMMTIETQVRQVRVEHRNATYGEIAAAAEACQELEEAFSRSLSLNTDERTRLVHAESLIDKAYNQKQKDVQDFTDDVKALFSADSIRRGDAEHLVSEADGARLYDLQLLMYAAATRHKLNILRAYVDIDADDGRGELADLKLRRERETMREDLAKAADTLASLAVTRAEAKASWQMKGWRNPPKTLDAFHLRGTAMREQLTQAPRAVLPAPSSVPMILEARLGDRGMLEVARAVPVA